MFRIFARSSGQRQHRDELQRQHAGLDNAATPLGPQAMRGGDRIGQDVAIKSMIMFLVLNTAGITLIPTSVIAIRRSMAVQRGLVGFNAADILPTLLGTFISFVAGLVAVAWVQRINLLSAPVLASSGLSVLTGGMYAWLAPLPPPHGQGSVCVGSGIILSSSPCSSAWPRGGAWMSTMLRRGAEEGFGWRCRSFPYLIAMLVAISGVPQTGVCMDYLIGASAGSSWRSAWTCRFRAGAAGGTDETLSGSGARGLMVDAMSTYGVSTSFQGRHGDHPGLDRNHFLRAGGVFRRVNITARLSAVACELIADGVGLVGRVVVGYLFYHAG